MRNANSPHPKTKQRVKKRRNPGRHRGSQLGLPGFEETGTRHGGSLSRGKRKTRRPLSTKKSIHVVLKSERARGRRALINYVSFIQLRIRSAAKRFRIRVHGRAIHSNQIHLHVEGRTRADLQNFFRVVAGHIAQRILSLVPLKPSEKKENRPGGRRFWMDLIFSRVVARGSDFQSVVAYLRKNVREVEDSLGVFVATVVIFDSG